MYEHRELVGDGGGAVGLHDCRTDRIDRREGTLSFAFPGGFYLLRGGKAVRTGPAHMECRILDEDVDGISVFVYRETPSGKLLREDWSDNFAAAVNSGSFVFEFVTVYRSYQRVLFKGYVWFDTPPYHRECEIELHTDHILYRWDDPPTQH